MISSQLDLIGASSLTTADRAVSQSTLERIRRSVADNTNTAYRRQWADFASWCETEGRLVQPATPETLADYINTLVERGLTVSSCRQAIAAIRTRHRVAGHPNTPDLELVNAVLRTAGRDRAQNGNGGTKKALPVIVDALRKMIDTCQGGTLIDARDHAILTLGIAIFARRSELVALNVTDLREVPEGLVVRIRSSKTDKAGKGMDVPVLNGAYPGTDPVRAVSRWNETLGAWGMDRGRLFRSIDRHGRIAQSMSGNGVNLMLQGRARLAGLANPEGYSAHSLRAGAATIAYMNGAPVSEICRLGRWAEGSSVVLGYIRSVDQWKNHPFRGVL
ncbi:MAG: integrase family protein [Streptosporangiaceae bacterium]|nr:integrase family protein [Streptosporangiaceae bacterium]